MTVFSPLSTVTHRLVRGTILNPQSGGTIGYLADGALVADENGLLLWVGPFDQLPPAFAALPVTHITNAIITPPFLDLHTHIPQYPLKGHFTEGIVGDPPEGRLLAGLNRNVFPKKAAILTRNMPPVSCRRSGKIPYRTALLAVPPT